jgi:hypothetical protein
MRSRGIRIGLGALLAAAALVLIFSPLSVATALHRPAETSSQMINLRASWGGTLLGLAAFVAWLPGVRPWRRFVLGLVMWGMVGIGLARAVGFVLDGHPNTLQWIWMTAEIAIASACAFALVRGRSRA